VRVRVITISDRAFRGEYEDLSGPEIEKVLKVSHPEWQIERVIVPDEKDRLLTAFRAVPEPDYIITTGGTGISPRDITPETTAEFCSRLLPGIAEMLRSESRTETSFAVFSRGTAGVHNKTIVVNLPGSRKGAEFCAGLLSPLMEHGVKMLRGEGH
jgi:molybdopterin adenylyltransferase